MELQRIVQSNPAFQDARALVIVDSSTGLSLGHFGVSNEQVEQIYRLTQIENVFDKDGYGLVGLGSDKVSLYKKDGIIIGVFS